MPKPDKYLLALIVPITRPRNISFTIRQYGKKNPQKYSHISKPIPDVVPLLQLPKTKKPCFKRNRAFQNKI